MASRRWRHHRRGALAELHWGQVDRASAWQRAEQLCCSSPCCLLSDAPVRGRRLSRDCSTLSSLPLFSPNQKPGRSRARGRQALQRIVAAARTIGARQVVSRSSQKQRSLSAFSCQQLEHADVLETRAHTSARWRTQPSRRVLVERVRVSESQLTVLSRLSSQGLSGRHPVRYESSYLLHLKHHWRFRRRYFRLCHFLRNRYGSPPSPNRITLQTALS